MKRASKITALFLSIIMVLTLIPMLPVFAAQAPTITAAYAVNETQVLVKFSAPIAIDSSKSTRFAMRIIDGNNNQASGTTDAFQTITAEKFVWANAEHSALLWNIASGTGHPASTSHWLGQSLAEGQKVAFCIIDLATTGDADIDAVTLKDDSGVHMQRMNTTGAGQAVCELTVPETEQIPRIVSAEAVSSTFVRVTFNIPVNIDLSKATLFAMRKVDSANALVSGFSDQITMTNTTGKFAWANEEHTAILWPCSATHDLDYWLGLTPGDGEKVCFAIIDSGTADNNIDAVTGVDSGINLQKMNAAANFQAVSPALIDARQSITAPTITKAEAINATQFKITFSAPVDFSKMGYDVRFGLRDLDANNNYVTGGADSYRTTTEATWVEGSNHTQMLFTVPGPTTGGVSATTEAWITHQAGLASGTRTCFYIMEVGNKGADMGCIRGQGGNGVLQKMNTDANSDMAACEITDARATNPVMTKAEAISNTHVKVTFDRPVNIDLSKATLFAMRKVDANNNLVTGFSDQVTMTNTTGKFAWANEEHTAIIWPCSATHGLDYWLGLSLNAGEKVCFAVIDTGTQNGTIDAISDAADSDNRLKKMNTTGSEQALCELTDARAATPVPPTIVKAEAVNSTQFKITFSKPVVYIKRDKSVRFGLRVVDGDNNYVSGGAGNHYTIETTDWDVEWADDTHTSFLFTVPAHAEGTTVAASTAAWLNYASTLASGSRACFYIMEVAGSQNMTSFIAQDDGSALQKMNTSGSPMAVCELSDARPTLPTLVSAEVLNAKQIKATFSAPVAFDFANFDTRFSLRTLNAEHNRVAETDEIYKTMSDDLYTWANDEHTAVIWTLPSGTTTDWLKLNASYIADGSTDRVNFCVIDTSAKSADMNINGISLASDANLMPLKMNTSGSDTICVPITQAVEPIAAFKVSDTQARIVTANAVKVASATGFKAGATASTAAVIENGEEFGTSVLVTFPAGALAGVTGIDLLADALRSYSETPSSAETVAFPVWDDSVDYGTQMTLDTTVSYSFMNADTGRELFVGNISEFTLVKGDKNNLYTIKSADQYLDITGAAPVLGAQPVSYLFKAVNGMVQIIPVDGYAVVDTDGGVTAAPTIALRDADEQVISSGWFMTAEEGIKPVKVMPIGDSLTYGTNPDQDDPHYGYRKQLSEALIEYFSGRVVFVGLQTTDETTLTDGYLLRHNGFPGYCVKAQDGSNQKDFWGTNPDAVVTDIVNKYDPDVACFLMGANDIGHMNGHGEILDPEVYTADGGLLDQYELFVRALVAQMNGDGTAFCSSVKPGRDEIYNQNVVALNALLEARVKGLQEEGLPVLFRDVYAVIDDLDNDISSDNLHLSEAGYAKLAVYYENIIKAVYNENGLKKSFTVSVSEENFTLTYEEGYSDTVTYGMPTRFTIVPDSGYSADDITVEANETEVTPNESGVYSLIDVTEDITVTVSGIKEETQEIKIGDVTGDDVVDVKDVVRYKKYFAKYDFNTGISSQEMVLDAADCNGDGKLNLKDIVRLKKYLASPTTVVLGA